MSIIRRKFLCVVGAAIGCGAAGIHPAAATLRTWPGPAPCDGTLNECITAASNDDIIEIVTDEPIDEDVAVNKPLSLMAGPGYRPALAAGKGIAAYYGPGAGIPWNMAFEGLKFIEGGIGLRAFSGDANITLRNLDVYAAASSYVGGAIGIDNFGIGHLTFEIAGNRVRMNDSVGVAAIAVSSSAGSIFEGSIHDNRLESTATTADTAIQLVATQASAPGIAVYSNQASGHFGTGVILWPGAPSNAVIVDNAFSTTVTNQGAGISLVNSGIGGVLDAALFNNTAVNFSQGVLVNGPITGRAANNILAYSAGQGLKLQTSTMPEDHNIFFANGTPQAMLGTGSMVADPKFRRGKDDVRIGAGSPAIDSADSAALDTLLGDNGVAQVDADGLRRFKGAANLADIGAFEFGDASLIVNASAANAGVIDDPLLNNAGGALPQLVQDRNPDTYVAIAIDPGMTGLQYASNRFGVIDEIDGSGAASGSAYNVFVPDAGDGAFLHVSASASNVFGFTTLVGNSYTDGHPERIVLATHRAAPLFDHPYGLVYLAGSWFIQQLDAQGGDPDFADGVAFHVYAQDPSLNAFVLTAPASANSVAIIHPLLDGEPCGRIYVGNGNLDPHPFGVRYEQGGWSIVNLDGAAVPQGASFYVVIDEAATQFCRYDHIFHDGVEGL
jgi:hypothetical protein